MISLLLCLLMLAALPLSASAMRIQHNVTALNAHRNLTNNNSMLTKNLEKLSSGYRINRAGDDAAGLAISEKMRAQITDLGQTWSKDMGSEWYYVYEAENQAGTSRNAKVWQDVDAFYEHEAAKVDEEKVYGFTMQLLEQESPWDGEQLTDQDTNWDAIEELTNQYKLNMFSGLYGQNDTPQGMFTGVRTDSTANGIGYEMNDEGKLTPSFQLTLTVERQICVNDNPQVALVNTQGDVTFYAAGTVNIGVFDVDGEVVDSFSIQVNEDGALETAPYANKMTLQLGDTGTFQADFINNQSAAMESNTRVRDISIADEMLAYTKNNILLPASRAALTQANQLPQGALELLQ